MKNKVQTSKSLTGVLLVIALTLLSVAVASAQTSGTTSTTEATTFQTKQAAATDSTAVTSVGLDAGVTSLAADSNGNVYASLQYTNKVVKMNGAGTVIGTFAAGRNPTGLVVDNAAGVLYALNNADNTISKFTLAGTLVATFPVDGDGPVYAALYNGTLYVACERSNTLVRLAASNGAALGSTPVGARPVWVKIGVTSSRMAFSEPIDAAPADTTTAAPADTTTTAPTDESIMAPADGTTMDGDATSAKMGTTASVYVSCNKANQVWKLSASGGVLAKFDTGRGPFGLAVNSRGELLVACFWDAVVMRLSSAGTVLSKTSVGDGPAGLIPYGNVVAVVSNGANSLSRLSLADGSFISKDLVDRSPLIGTATASALWVACTGTGTIAKRSL